MDTALACGINYFDHADIYGGGRPCKRYKTIKVQYQTLEMQTRTKNFTGWTAETPFSFIRLSPEILIKGWI